MSQPQGTDNQLSQGPGINHAQCYNSSSIPNDPGYNVHPIDNIGYDDKEKPPMNQGYPYQGVENKDCSYHGGTYNPNIPQEMEINQPAPVYLMNNNTNTPMPQGEGIPVQTAGSGQTGIIQETLVNKPRYVKGKHFPCFLAYTVFFLNWIIPGLGTMIGIWGITDPNLKTSYCCMACYEFIMAFCIIGYCIAICHSCVFIGASQSDLTFEEYASQMRERRMVLER